MKLLSLFSILCGFILCLQSCGHRHADASSFNGSEPTARDSISEALAYQLSHYPASQYRDVYKNFMQDFFGPGHILVDTAAAGKYLRAELNGPGPFDGPLYEKTGYRGNFYRVNLSVIRKGIVPYDKFFRIFVESMDSITPPSAEEWMRTWSTIDSVIKEQNLSFPEEAKDRRELAEQLRKGDFVVHHSQRFNDSVHFHYRIISRSLFESEILPRIEHRRHMIRGRSAIKHVER